MGNHHDSVALDWVRGEIQETLKQGQFALEAYVENRDDTARLRFCLNHLHQVHGTLQMVELFGAALLTEEMERLAQALLQDKVTSADEAIQVLMQAILQLPQYLGSLKTASDDFPLLLLPLLNDLRASRSASLLSDSALFNPDLSPAHFKVPAGVGQRLQDSTVLGHVRKLRHMFQFAIAGILREADLDTHFDYMDKVLARLIKLCQQSPVDEIWIAAGAFLETLKARRNPISSATKSILRGLDLQLKRLIDEHGDSLQRPIDEKLLKNLLYYVARCVDLETPQVRQLVARYKLEHAVPNAQDVENARKRTNTPNRDAIRSVVIALNEELAKLKDQLDLFMRAEFRKNQDLEDLLPSLHQIANTLAVIGLGLARKVINEQIHLIEKLSASEDAIDDGMLMDIAGALLYVEGSLGGLADQGVAEDDHQGEATIQSRELNLASAALLREARNSLEQVKTAIVNFIASQWNHDEISQVPALLHSIRGGLKLIPLDPVCDLLASCERYISDVLLAAQRVPEWQQLDTLADAVTSIEYYLERLVDGVKQNDAILRVAEESLTALGFPPGAEPTWVASEHSEQTPVAAPEAPKQSDAELMDDEILEIFVEEADEVLQTIRDYLPQFRDNTEDRAAATEVRRAFHTLKGSGRLVGATSIAELSWAIEDLLNRVLENSLRPSDALFGLMAKVTGRMPALIEAFRHGDVTPDVAALIAEAEVLLSERRPVGVSDEAGDTVSTGAITGTTTTTPPLTAPVAEVADDEIETETAEDAEADEALTAEADDEDNLIDDEIIEIFLEEAGEVLTTINDYLPALVSNFDDRAALTEIRRAFHTMKGSGRMVGATIIGELSWSVENLLNRVIEGNVFLTQDAAQLLQQVTGILPDLVGDFEKRRKQPSHDTTTPIARLEALARGEILSELVMPLDEAHADELPATPVAAEAQLPESDIDPELLEIFRSETELHLQTLQAFVEQADGHESIAFTDALSRALHTLKGSAHTAEIRPLAEVITPLEKYCKNARAQGLKVHRELIELIEQAEDFIVRTLAQLDSNPQARLAGSEAFLAQLDSLSKATLQSDVDTDEVFPASNQAPALLDLFVSDSIDILLHAEDQLRQWAEAPQTPGIMQPLMDELNRLATGANQAALSDLSELSETLVQIYDTAERFNRTPDESLLTQLRSGHELLVNMMDQLAAGLTPRPDNALLADLREQVNVLQQPILSEMPDEFKADLSALDQSLDEHPDLAPWNEPASAPAPEPVDAGEAAAMDEELIGIFLEEAHDLVRHTGEHLRQFSNGNHQAELLRLMQQDIHTLKGGARLAEITSIADLSHELETLLEGISDQRLAITPALEDLLLRSHDRLDSMLQTIASGEASRPAPDLLDEIRNYIAHNVCDPEAADLEATDLEATDLEATDLESVDLEMPDFEVQAENAMEAPDTRPDDFANTPDGNLTETATLDPANLDPELAEIFLEEAGDIIDTTSDLLHRWQADPSQLDWVKALQRELHTLKGGARMAEISPIADLAHELETLFERIVEGRLQATTARLDLCLRSHDQLSVCVEAIAEQRPCPANPQLIHALRACLQDDEPLNDAVPEAVVPEAAPADISETELTAGLPETATAEADAQLSEPEAELEATPPEAAETEIEADIELPEAAELPDAAMPEDATPEDITSEDITPEAVTETAAPDEAVSPVYNEAGDMDPELAEIFLEEAQDLIHATATTLQDWVGNPDSAALAASLQRDLHTLKGGARMAGVSAIGDLAHLLEDLFERIADGRIAADATRMNDLLFACHDRLALMVENIAAKQQADPARDLEAQVVALLRGEAAPVEAPAEEAFHHEDDEQTDNLIGMFLEDARDLQASLAESLAQWQDNPAAMHGVTNLQQELSTLKGAARLADVDAIAQLAESWDKRLQEVIQDAPGSSAVLPLSTHCLSDLARMLTQIEEGIRPTGNPALAALLSCEDSREEQGEGAAAETTQIHWQQDAEGEQALDEEVLEIFLEEAGELVDNLDHILSDWRKDPGSEHFNQDAQRVLHTLKGGARLAQLTELGNASHEMESRLTQIQTSGQPPASSDWDAIGSFQDQIISLIERVAHRRPSAPAQTAAPTPAKSVEAVPAEQAPTALSAYLEQTVSPADAGVLQASAQPIEKSGVRPPESRRKGISDAARNQQQETIRVSAPLLDSLSNFAGETSIIRGRLEQQTSYYSRLLDEMSATIERLREQLRRMDIETETQILFRTEREMGPSYDDFDPLEMDRYSSIQQLSRALSESASDLMDLRDTLSDRVRDTETLLVQQSRINTELQEGLMKTRMVPFSSTVPRLRRIVRQISGELGKRVEFEVRNGEGEMDRTVLERMIGPLEHMLRNALDHGIETPAVRQQAGKAETGTIELQLSREGGEVVLRMLDDGAGIRVDMVREKAIRQGMLTAADQLSDRDLLQFILLPGFSTAQQVTQISGRGVGMDVVASEIKQLGGSLDIDSTVGKGTVFTVRLPFTVSVNRALMVATGEDFYAIPLNTIEGIVRVSTFELEEYYQPDAPLYEYAGQKYRLQYLGGLLRSDHQPKLQGQALPLPVILVRGGDQPIALQVDSLMGSREIVVKSLGAQFSSVRGVSGATILGDGNVVVILDLPAMIRADLLSARQRQATPTAETPARGAERPTQVMVVDDSVTVRKVTSRLLERHGMDVLLAKDGLDAVAQLQDHVPDVILLDIEMPRMDGFEVASFIRHDERLQNVPIIMITSRTGAKHRERAMSIGVNEYLGKPFQESELMSTIERLVEIR